MTHVRVAAAGLVMLAIAGHAWAEPSGFRVSELEGFVPAAINNQGQIVGNGPGGGALYRDGRLTLLGAGVQARDINDLGQITGSASGSAFIWREGSLQLIGPGRGNSINNCGWVAGEYGRYLEDEYVARGFLYDGNTYQDLLDLYDPSRPATTFSSGKEINEAGHIVGAVDQLDPRAILFADGVMHDVTLPQSAESFGVTLNDRGEVAGFTGGLDTYFYDNGTFSLVATPADAEPRRSGISERRAHFLWHGRTAAAVGSGAGATTLLAV